MYIDVGISVHNFLYFIDYGGPGVSSEAALNLWVKPFTGIGRYINYR